METSAPTNKSKHRAKRNSTQRAADLKLVETYALQGKTHLQIVELLASIRPEYQLSRQMVTHDLARLRRSWHNSTLKAYAEAREMELRRLNFIESELWTEWDRSKCMDRGGDSTYTAQILAVCDKRAKILGLYAPTKVENSGPNGGPIPIANVPLTDDAQQEILRRHFQREKEDQDERSHLNRIAVTSTPDSATAAPPHGS